MNPAVTLPVLLFVSEGGGGPEVMRRLPDGTIEAVTERPGDDFAGPVSPDGRATLVVSARGERFQLGVVDTAGGPVRPLGPVALRVQSTAWSPDGRWVAAAVQTGTSAEILRISTRTGAHRPLVSRPGGAFDADVSPDGRTVVFIASGERGPDLWRVAATGGPPELLLPVDGEQLDPTWSPDGSRIAFFSSHMGRMEVRTVGADGRGDRVAWRPGRLDGEAVPTDGLVWSAEGRWLTFTRFDTEMQPSVAVVDVQRGVLVYDSSRDAGLRAQSPAWLDDTSLVAAARIDGDLELVRLGLDGETTRLTTRPGEDWLPRVVPSRQPSPGTGQPKASSSSRTD